MPSLVASISDPRPARLRPSVVASLSELRPARLRPSEVASISEWGPAKPFGLSGGIVPVIFWSLRSVSMAPWISSAIPGCCVWISRTIGSSPFESPLALIGPAPDFSSSAGAVR